MKVPTISGISPNPAKTGGQVTVTGQDLDLVTSVTFGGGKNGAVQSGGSATEITVSVPADAQEGTVSFGTAAAKSVTSGATLALVKPAITSIAPTDVQFTNEITVTGNDLDIVSKVKFSGGTEAAPSSTSLTELKVNVPVGTTSGAITLVANNGDEVTSAQALNILASTSAVITSMPASAKPGELINIVGENLGEITEVIFPVDISATMFGIKTNELIQVIIPANRSRRSQTHHHQRRRDHFPAHQYPGR
jgi:hypothetical protein